MLDTERLVTYIGNVLDKECFEVTSANFDKAIKVTGKGKAKECGVWIRIEIYGDDIIFNVNSVYLQHNFRGKGILTKICKAAIDSGEITGIEVTGVSTDEMHAWCRKRNMIEDKQKMKYTYKLKQTSKESDSTCLGIN